MVILAAAEEDLNPDPGAMHFIILVERSTDYYYPAFSFFLTGVDVEKKGFFWPPMRPKGGRVINFSLKIPLILEMLYTN